MNNAATAVVDDARLACCCCCSTPPHTARHVVAPPPLPRYYSFQPLRARARARGCVRVYTERVSVRVCVYTYKRLCARVCVYIRVSVTCVCVCVYYTTLYSPFAVRALNHSPPFPRPPVRRPTFFARAPVPLLLALPTIIVTAFFTATSRRALSVGILYGALWPPRPKAVEQSR